MRIVGMIPVRMAATRFPGKPLAPLLGRTMLEHVYRRSKRCGSLSEVIVTTCDEEIRRAAEQFGAPVIMTSDRHRGATERVAEAAMTCDADVVVLIQGDEPMLQPEMLEELVAPLKADPAVQCANLMVMIGEQDARDPDQIKVVCDLAGDALYMTREPVPSPHRGAVTQWGRQVGLIAFRKAFLLKLMSLPPTPLEQAESVDMLRAIEHGLPVRMVVTRHHTHPVDTPEDLTKVEAFMRNDPLLASYTSADSTRR